MALAILYLPVEVWDRNLAEMLTLSVVLGGALVGLAVE